MTLREYNLMQIIEALGCTNRWYFTQHYGREPRNDNELVMYYCEHGGARHFHDEHKGEING